MGQTAVSTMKVSAVPSFEILLWKGIGFETNTDAHIEVEYKFFFSFRGNATVCSIYLSLGENLVLPTNFANRILSLKAPKG